MTKVAVILSGCGYLDGAEIREAVLSLLYLDAQGAEVSIFAPDIAQADVVNHLTGKPADETRNVLVESARIARGKIEPISALKPEDFDALVLPGGFGAAKNLSNLAQKGPGATVNEEYGRIARAFYKTGKPIGAICISPAVLMAALKGVAKPKLTIGEDKGTAGAIEAMGGTHVDCETAGAVVDQENRIVSCSAYMRDDPLKDVAAGIEKLVREVLTLAKSPAREAA